MMPYIVVARGHHIIIVKDTLVSRKKGQYFLYRFYKLYGLLSQQNVEASGHK